MTHQLSMPLTPVEAFKGRQEFPGQTFDKARDGLRLNAQERRVYELMKDGKPRGLREISKITGDPEASISARLRGFRDYGFQVDLKYISRGLWHYTLKVNA